MLAALAVVFGPFASVENSGLAHGGCGTIITHMRRRASRPGRARQPDRKRFDPAEVLGLLIDCTGTPKEGDVNLMVSDVLMDDHELGGGMLRLVQTMRDTSAIHENEALHLFYWITEQMSFRWSATDPELTRLTEVMDAIERSHGLSEAESFHLDDAPPEWIALSREWDRRLDTLWAEEFTRLGEPELARLARVGALHEDRRVYEGRASLRARAADE